VVYSGPNASPVAERNKVCLTCHQGGMVINWTANQHASNDVACTSCHSLHGQEDKVKTRQGQPEVCFTCHTEQRSQSYRFSHHPIREGKVICSDCHNPHGSAGEKMLKQDTVNETCYDCHPEKRGPLAWEHQPVRENCVLCHNPHGSSSDRLLKQRMPSLCADCHADPGIGGSGQFISGGSIHSNVEGNPLQFRQCMYCHSQIHGSNSPAGAYFIR
jgi:DmsE family decaheme c-type cytochrome